MKILHVITRMVHGGAQLNTLMCATEQARRGHQVTLITGPETGPEGSLLERAERAPIRLIVLPHMVRRPHPWLDLLVLVALYRHLAQEKYDVVHTHTSKAGLVGRIAAWAARAPVIVHTPHGHVFHSYFHPMMERVFVLLERATAWTCQAMVMLTEGERRDHLHEKIAPPDRFLVVPSGVDLTDFQPGRVNAASLGLPEGQTLVGTVLRLVEIKGVFDLIEAFHQVSQAVSDCHLAIAGNGPLRADLEQRIRELGLGQRITMLGHVDPVGPFLRSLDLFVLPSHNEGMGRAVVEAMATGLPIVCTRIGGLPDLVEEGINGLLVPPCQPPQLAEAMQTLLTDRTRAEAMGRASLERAPAFSAQVMYDRLEALYARLSAPRRRG